MPHVCAPKPTRPETHNSDRSTSGLRVSSKSSRMQRKQPLAVTGVEHDQQQQRMDPSRAAGGGVKCLLDRRH